MNRKKKEKRVLREERNVSVLFLYVKVPAGATAPVDDEPWKLTRSIKLQTGEDTRSRVKCWGATRHFVDGSRREREKLCPSIRKP